MKRFIFLLSVIFIQNAFSQGISLKTGEEFAIDSYTAGKGTYISDAHYTFWFKVLGKDDSLNYRLLCKLVRTSLKNESVNGVTIELNSDNVKLSKLRSSSGLLPLALLHKPFTITVNPRGQITSVEGIKEIIGEAIIKWKINQSTETLLKRNSVNFPETALRNMFFQLPENKVRYLSSWTTSENNTKTDFKVTGIKGALLIIQSKGKYVGQSSQTENTGLYSLNDVTGLIENSSISIKGYSINPSNGKQIITDQTITQKLLTAQPYPAVDTSWINMFVKMGFFSNALRQGVEYDSVKVARFFSENDPKYNNDPYYNVNKLYLMQNQGSSYKAHMKYSEQLAKTPNNLLTGELAHLSNKIGNVLLYSADSAYAVAKYFYKEKMFNDWLQQSYSQSFIDHPPRTEDDILKIKNIFKKEGLTDEEIEKLIKDGENEKVNSYKLLEILHLNKDPIIQRKIQPMYLWVSAKEKKNDPAALIKAAGELKKLDDSFMQSGNGGRYGLLIYKLLNDANKKEDSESLLNHMIKQLEKYTADTLNRNRYAHQNLLASAYYFKYLSDKRADSVKALRYLSRAAHFSPKGNEEKSYDSFYDRVFLDTKESYREEFINTLFSNGNNEEALKIFTEHFNSNPDQMEEMKKLFIVNFPERSFNDFFSENILSAWVPAPDFALKGIDYKQYSLKDYKGKWLAIDFWGTWCSPCREEMPDINKFNQDLAEGKYPGINFLSIACKDTEDRVNTYFKQNKFAIPTVMSDNTVEKNFKVQAYPSKFIIAPNGKMLEINYGQDWEVIIKKFQEIYPSK